MRISDWSSDVCSSDLMAGFGRVGTPSATVRLRAMANDPDGEALLSELKAVDGAYPLYGTMRLESGARRGPPPSGAIWIGKDLASRLALKVGSQVKFGDKAFLIDGIIAEEPDRLGEGLTHGPVEGRQSVAKGKSVYRRVSFGGRRINKKNNR